MLHGGNHGNKKAFFNKDNLMILISVSFYVLYILGLGLNPLQ